MLSLNYVGCVFDDLMSSLKSFVEVDLYFG